MGYYLIIYISLFLLLIFVGVVLYYKMISMPGSTYQGPWRPLDENETLIRENLVGHVQQLAQTIGERNMQHHLRLERAAQYITKQFETYGYKVDQHAYQVNDHMVSNIIAEISGTSHPEEIVIIGAHYDSVLNSPGANDNASGVAILLELARLMQHEKPNRTIRFIAFVNEEQPYYKTHLMGSYQYAKKVHSQGENIVAMASLETIGYFSDQPNSQRYPFPFMFFYPKEGNFIGFVGRMSDKELIDKSIRTFRKHTLFPSQGVAAPGWIAGVSWSDHWSFWHFNYPAIMITDTALYRYPDYHSPKDTPEGLQYEKMARVTSGLQRVFLKWATVGSDKSKQQ